jgi:predicted phage-related endonuclease
MRFYQTKEEFYESKKRTIGASEVSIILGRSQFETRYELWLSKINLTKRDPNKYSIAGNMLESSIVERFYTERNEKFIKEDNLLSFSHPEYDFIIVHPDDIWRGERLLEAKTTQKYLTDVTVIPYVTDMYFPQWNFTLGVIKENEPDFLDTGFLIMFSRGVDYFEIPFQFDPELYQQSLKEVIAFKKLVDNNTPPELYRADYDLVYSTAQGGDVYADARLKEVYQRLCELKVSQRDLDEEKERLTYEVKQALKEKERVIDPDNNEILITWKNTARSRVFRVYEKT